MCTSVNHHNCSFLGFFLSFTNPLGAQIVFIDAYLVLDLPGFTGVMGETGMVR